MFYIFFAQGFEEVEAISTLDVIRRANIDIKSVGIGSSIIEGSHGMKFICDMTDNEFSLSEAIEGIILPGGMPGTTNLMLNENVNNAIDYCFNNNLLLCAICAAPIILGKKGILKNKSAVCFPGFENELIGAFISEDYVCRDNNIITAKGMGSAVDFGIQIVSAVKGDEFASDLKNTLQCPQ